MKTKTTLLTIVTLLCCLAAMPLVLSQSTTEIKAIGATYNASGTTSKDIVKLSTVARGLMDSNARVVTDASSGSLVFEGATADAYETTLAITDPTADRTITVPNGSGTVGLQATATLTAGATPAFAPGSSTSCYLLTPGEDETINATTTGAVAGRSYFIRILTSGTTSRTLTFGTNFKSTGTLATGTTTAKTFVVQFIFDGTNFCEVSRTTAM